MEHEEERPANIRVEIAPSAPRRIVATIVLLSVGAMIVHLALTSPPATLFWQLFLIVFGALIAFGAIYLFTSTSNSLILTRSELSDSSGRVLARFEDIVSIDRGVFAFKPSNGFIIYTRNSGRLAWAPGLWWRVGRRVGVGGVTPALQTKALAEAMTVLLEESKG